MGGTVGGAALASTSASIESCLTPLVAPLLLETFTLHKHTAGHGSSELLRISVNISAGRAGNYQWMFWAYQRIFVH